MCVCVWGELINPGVLRNALGRKERKEGRGGGGGARKKKEIAEWAEVGLLGFLERKWIR